VTDDPLLIIGGPTAVGKSDLAIAIAQKLGGELINLDSVQIYKDFIIGSAQPDEEEKKIVPHHLFGVLDPTEKISVGKYLKLFQPIETDIRQRGKLPILVGGTSLYLNGVLHGLADLPEDQNVREQLEKLTNEEIYSELSQAVSTSQLQSLQIHPNDRVRLSRALEVLRLGHDIELTRIEHSDTLPRRALIIIPMLPREHLYDRINLRVEKMIEKGLCSEVQSIIEQYGLDLPPARSIGYKETVKFLSKNDQPTESLIEEIAQNTRRFAKRQMTWLRNEPIKRGWNVKPSQIPNVSENRKSSSFASISIPRDELISEIDLFLKQPIQVGESPVSLWFVDAISK
jgi:tRNA dimethylallyltransferase